MDGERTQISAFVGAARVAGRDERLRQWWHDEIHGGRKGGFEGGTEVAPGSHCSSRPDQTAANHQMLRAMGRVDETEAVMSHGAGRATLLAREG